MSKKTKVKERKEPKEMYQVKIVQTDNPDNVLFGRVERYTDGFDEAYAEGFLLIEEPVYGKRYKVPMNEFEIIDMPFGDWSKRDKETGMSVDTEYDRYINDEYKKHQARSDAAGEGIKKHKMFQVGVADGYAVYVITSAGKKNVKIEWRGFCADNYTDMTLGWGGSFPRHCIEPHIGWADARKKLFSKKA
jgi:hypothetical protein